MGYERYNALNNAERKALSATNFWLIAAGREPIEVPASDKDYHKYFTEHQKQQALAIWNDRQTGFREMVTINPVETVRRTKTTKVVDDDIPFSKKPKATKSGSLF